EKMLAAGSELYGPCAFQTYLAEHGILSKRGTAELISVDSAAKLDANLRKNQAMVLRLGSPKGKRGTWFGLVKARSGLEEFFLFDKDVFSASAPEVHLSSASQRDLFAYQLLQKTLTEGSFVNLSVISGLLARALGLDGIPLGVATTQSTFSFKLK